jgi:hypothetical protein
VWPEEPGAKDKMMHFEIPVDDLPAAVDYVLALGGREGPRSLSTGTGANCGSCSTRLVIPSACAPTELSWVRQRCRSALPAGHGFAARHEQIAWTRNRR